MTSGPSPFHDGRWRSWGRVIDRPHQIAHPAFTDQVTAAFDTVSAPDTALAVGMGRSYGDTNLHPDGVIIDMRGVNRLLAFDPETRVLRAEAGATLSDILDFAVPKGFFLPTTPGTRFVTLGGAIANDVHGKNHHRASTFGCWIRQIELYRSDKGRVTLMPDDPLFAATVGGLGLTGIILAADIELVPIPSSELDQELIPFGDLAEFFALAKESEDNFEHTVSWIDCLARGKNLGRGIFSRANWSVNGPVKARSYRQSRRFPMDAPSFVLNRFSIAAFNSLYYTAQRLKGRSGTVPYDSFFYPLDAIGDWNRLYGKKGFYQYQSVIPPHTAEDATRDMLQAISDAGDGSFLAVLKTFGEKHSPGLLSFPAPGVTLALDFPNRGEKTLDLLSRLDDIVRAAEGRLYPAKDGRLPADMFTQGYSRLEEFRTHLDPTLSSHFWQRIRMS